MTQTQPTPNNLAASQMDAELVPMNLDDLNSLLKEGSEEDVCAAIGGLHAADQAELIDGLAPEQRQKLAGFLGEEFNHEVLPELRAEAADDVLEGLGVELGAEALTQLETDDAVHIMEDLDDADQAELLQAIPKEYRKELQEGLAYPEESAGRLMRKTLVAVPQFWKVGDAIDHMRAQDEMPENFYIIYVTDPKYRPIGRLPLGQLMTHGRETALGEIMIVETHSIRTDTDQEEVAFKFSKYGLVESPVVNEEGKLVGTITVDDVVDVMREEEEEDFLASAGLKAQDLQASLKDTVSKRFPWLFVNLLTAVLASLVIGFFAGTIEQLVALAVLMPIVASMGGNAGTQSVTIAVRAIATKQLRAENTGYVVRKELVVGLMNGLGLALIMAGGAYFWYQDMTLALVLGSATILTLTIAGLAGALIPVILNKCSIDPAVASGVFLTTVTDVIGFFTFLGLAAWWLA